ncbi:DNA-binding protein [Streptomyces sp. SA15]|uniref:formylglycine-generating enzyme family protein n=1 Tax=Streptomyces sp. SA15 TaxID=934019 RepID=UPI000BAE9CCA|nr:SUMF1/EgtB/PvdO family nonheme iron enzyme [Streptomyces sp. SA15]PAZ12269.1 DNA-binding protein [Streptomyces sp. SA15]
MAGVTRWTGREVLLLREALRKNGKDFAAMVGVSHRQLVTWEGRGASIRLRPDNQEALDTLLARAGLAVQQRFAELLTEKAAAEQDERAEELLRRDPRSVRHPVDGKIMVTVDEGIYLSGAEGIPTWVGTFRIDIFPTTNADYERFVRATGQRPPQHWPGGRCPDGLFDHPVVWVTWHDATAYARWCGKALPTAQQWEKAARGSKGRVYPWGDEPTAAKCNVSEAGIGATTPVARYQSGVSPYGVYDLCGNTWEWCSTEEGPGRYALKGSAFTSPFERAAPSLRNAASATMRDNDTGFRCVSAP